MSNACYELNGVRIFECPTEGPKLARAADALELIGRASELGAALIVIPLDRVRADFFDLRTGIAGDFIQKFVTYGSRVVILGDISERVEQSHSLAAWILELNRGNHLWFLKDRDELAQRLTRRCRNHLLRLGFDSNL
jgi:Domain of unknown function (DUF4180)